MTAWLLWSCYAKLSCAATIQLYLASYTNVAQRLHILYRNKAVMPVTIITK